MSALYLLSVWLHVVAAIVWIGGTLFLVLVLVPATRLPGCRPVAPRLIEWTGARFRLVGWICLASLVVSGTFNLAYLGFGWDDLWSGRLWQGPFGHALAVKLLLVAVILLLSILHDFVVGPRARRMWQRNPAAPETARLRRQAGWIGRINAILALVVVALGVILVRRGAF